MAENNNDKFFHEIRDEQRILMQISLKPLQGERFQPTGFPDLGPARYQLQDGTEMLLLESPQSVANRLELTVWDKNHNDLIEPLKGLPYIKVITKDEKFLTSSLIEAHRINSPYILEGEDKTIVDKIQKEAVETSFGAVDLVRFAQFLLKYDINSILHGVFISKSDLANGRLRLPRAVSGFIEARDVKEAESGGVKFDIVSPKGVTKSGFAHVPYHRTEFTAGEITAYFNIDIALLRSYGFDDAAFKLLVNLALFKIRRFLTTGLRLRTACDLTLRDEIVVTSPEGIDIPGENEILSEVQAGIEYCRAGNLFADPPVTTVSWTEKKSKKRETSE